MSRRVVLENEFVHLWYYPGERIVHHQFRKFIWGNQFREVLNEGLKVFELEGATKWLSDDRENSALSKDDTEWAMSDWFPRVAKAGWKYWSIVLPQNVIGQMNMTRFIAAYSAQGLTVRVFNEPGAALEWLEQAGPAPGPR
jgi:hypothetical protein